MGEAALSAFLQVLFQTIVDLLNKELQLEHGLENCEIGECSRYSIDSVPVHIQVPVTEDLKARIS